MTSRNVLMWLSPVVLCSAMLGLLAARAASGSGPETYWNRGLAEQIRAIVALEYVDEISDERGRELFYAAMEGYLRALDPYCHFMDPDERQDMEEDTSGEFGGVGVLVGVREQGLTVVGLRRGDPAESGGVEIGDVIVAVEGTPVGDLTMEEVTDLIRGRPGTPVRIGFRRGEEVFDLELTRSRIKLDSVLGARLIDEERGIGYLRVSNFQENTGPDARAALLDLRSRGARSFVLDLRLNRGGVLEKGAVALVDLFLEEGVIVETRGRAPGSRKSYSATREGTVCSTEPLVVLVDEGSASAAEVVAGAFQDHRRAVLVGERTYGKFLVQSIHRLPELDVAVALTTARYYTPYGRWLQRRDDQEIRGGLLPDVVVTRTRQETEALVGTIFPSHHGVDMVTLDEPVRDPDPQLDRAALLLADYDRLQAGTPR